MSSRVFQAEGRSRAVRCVMSIDICLPSPRALFSLGGPVSKHSGLTVVAHGAFRKESVTMRRVAKGEGKFFHIFSQLREDGAEEESQRQPEVGCMHLGREQSPAWRWGGQQKVLKETELVSGVDYWSTNQGEMKPRER